MVVSLRKPPRLSDIHSPCVAQKWILTGRVQGVGFRPFVFRLAKRYGLSGWVQNRTGQVEIFAQGETGALADFEQALVQEAPPLAEAVIGQHKTTECRALEAFEILPSDAHNAADVHLPPDYFACDDCINELTDPRNRRYRYPFINCTQCGPRYTLITRLPYDRINTTMTTFAMCPTCRSEYEDPSDRRFHAEPIACPVCGPRLNYVECTAHQIGNGNRREIHDSESALQACLIALRAGKIVAVKGVGGYHLMCDARSGDAVTRLRETKPRPHKPLAVMFPLTGRDGLDAVREAVTLTVEHSALLCSPMRPIVLIPRRAGSCVTPLIAPGLKEFGVMLPYSPLHHLLLEDFDAPLVATSANLSGEPVFTTAQEVESRLARVTNAFLHHDRPIERPADDSLFRVIAGRPRPLRLGRGSAPLELLLPIRLAAPVLAVGAHMKNTVALAWEQRVVISPHIGDLSTPRSLDVFEQLIADLQELYGIQAQAVISDAHPGYASQRWARSSGHPVIKVFHHHAHASALAGEFPNTEEWLVFTWDGVGYGADGTLWGGEALHGRPGAWNRVAGMRPFHLPGGEKAGREPWRSALALCWEAGFDWRHCPQQTDLLFEAWQKRLNAPQTTAVGRLFDAAAALTGVNHCSSFEGQGPMLLEAISDQNGSPIELPLDKNPQGIWQTDWAPLLPLLLNEKLPVGERAAAFHATMATALLAQARAVREDYGEIAVGLCGGVFQNRLLTELCITRLQEDGFEVHLNAKLPCNDAGISFGQVIEYAYLSHAR